MPKSAILCALFLLVGCSSPFYRAAGPPSMPPTRSFHIRYETALENLPRGKPLRLWIPVPSNDSYQVIRDLEIDSPWKSRVTVEPVHHNRMLFLEGTIESADMRVTIEYDVDRWERRTDFRHVATDGGGDERTYDLYREPSSLSVITDEIRAQSEQLSKLSFSTVERARSYYHHVQEQMVYDKTVPGWGRGDTRYACAVGKGNCTDYHSYFNSLCRAAGIPVRFQIGLYGSYEPRPGEELLTGDYHCWAEFRVPGKVWVPVDISEGDKNPERASYFFGNHSDNRVTLSTGRDLTLEPQQAGTPLNYFVDPYAEVDGEPFAKVSKKAFWLDSR